MVLSQGTLMRTLLVDNYDSYTFNLFQLIAEVNGSEPVVVRNDDPALLTLDLAAFDNIVISPGPGQPWNRSDVGFLAELLDRSTLPVLGICLGHQFLAQHTGGTVSFAAQPRHGHLTRVTHYGDPLFAGIPTGFTAVRYHSLRVEEPLPAPLIATAWAEDGIVMALRHRDLPRWGVQFHPESIASEHGRELLTNFARLSRPDGLPPTATPAPAPAVDRRPAAVLQLAVGMLPVAVDTEAAYRELWESSPSCFWLDSSRVERGLSRFSFLGDAAGPLGEVLTYRVTDGVVRVSDAAGSRTEPGTVFDVLDQRLRDRAIADPGLPFDFVGGYVGYFGYELKNDDGQPGRHVASTPDAVWIFAGRLIAVDHESGATYVLAVHDGTERQRAEADDWIRRTSERLLGLESAGSDPTLRPGVAVDPTDFLVVDQARYERDVQRCRDQLTRGESYEICLTNKLRLPFRDDDTAFYRRLRRANPVPYGALLRFDDVAVFCASPERFLRIEQDGTVESKPIKGTAARHPDPVVDDLAALSLAACPKTQAENLMIVDLLRNDLGQVCEVGSVAVAKYMAVESYATVHQLVSTVVGRLKPTVSPVECVRHCFPGGSMTGAPKIRTMAIIDDLETEARGVYSGALGYFGLSGGADLNIVIRTAVREGDELTIGAGGAIVLDSDPRAEFDEMTLKAASALRAFRMPELSVTGPSL